MDFIVLFCTIGYCLPVYAFSILPSTLKSHSMLYPKTSSLLIKIFCVDIAKKLFFFNLRVRGTVVWCLSGFKYCSFSFCFNQVHSCLFQWRIQGFFSIKGCYRKTKHFRLSIPGFSNKSWRVHYLPWLGHNFPI